MLTLITEWKQPTRQVFPSSSYSSARSSRELISKGLCCAPSSFNGKIYLYLSQDACYQLLLNKYSPRVCTDRMKNNMRWRCISLWSSSDTSQTRIIAIRTSHYEIYHKETRRKLSGANWLGRLTDVHDSLFLLHPLLLWRCYSKCCVISWRRKQRRSDWNDFCG